MIQLTPKPVPVRYSDPEEPLAGRCMTCKTVVSCLRRNASSANERSGPGHWNERGGLGTWNDLLSVECPQCGARVFVMEAKEFQKLKQG